MSDAFIPAPPVSIPHLALPFTLAGGNGPAATVEQDTIDDVTACVAVLANTDLGSRVELPTYGVLDQTFGSSYDTSVLVTAAATWEPRAQVAVAAGPGPYAQVNVVVALQGETPPTASVPAPAI